jgi:hypothetical protein
VTDQAVEAGEQVEGAVEKNEEAGNAKGGAGVVTDPPEAEPGVDPETTG